MNIIETHDLCKQYGNALRVAHLDLDVPSDVVVENVHLSESLMRLSYRVCSMQDQKAREEAQRKQEEAAGAGEIK